MSATEGRAAVAAAGLLETRAGAPAGREAVAAAGLLETRAGAPAAGAPALSSPPAGLVVLKMLDSLLAAKRALEVMRKQIEELVAADMALRPPQPLPAELDMSSAADTLCLLQASKPEPRKGAPGPDHRKRCSDLGRLVSVLWVPRGFGEEREPALKDLVAYRGIVVKDCRAGKHSRCKRDGMLLIRYQDGELAWAKKDKLLKFLD
jgi:hypothetical protein